MWDLYKICLELTEHAVPTLIEWDTDVPDFSVLHDEADKATQIMEAIFLAKEPLEEKIIKHEV